MINITLLIGLALTTAATPAATPSPPAAATATVSGATQVKAGADPDKVVCKYIATTGTRFMTKECHRQGDWDQLAQDSKKLTADSQMGFTANRH